MMHFSVDSGNSAPKQIILNQPTRPKQKAPTNAGAFCCN